MPQPTRPSARCRRSVSHAAPAVLAAGATPLPMGALVLLLLALGRARRGAAGAGRRRRDGLAGLSIALVGALLLATGMDLQSRRSRRPTGAPASGADHRWWAGVALAPPSGRTWWRWRSHRSARGAEHHRPGRLDAAHPARPGVLTRETPEGGERHRVLGFVAVLSAHPADSAVHDLDAQRAAVMTILATLTVLAGPAWLIGQHPGSSES